jgi:alpha-L-fucosidase
MDIDIIKAAKATPSKRQYEWQRTEFYAFIHFTVNTFSDREWGLGDEDPSIFNPTALDADQWVSSCKSAGMRGLILTCKHHDGFCLWPSEFTRHSVAGSPWRGGGGDLVREVSDACRRGGLKFGVYLSPWDRHEPSYGDSERYDDYFKNQLRELLTRYGEIFSVWFDGACGEGPNGIRQVYDWEGYYRTIRKYQPGAAISVCGPDVRWCGNEAGHCRSSEWSVVPAALRDTEKTAEKCQKIDDGAFSRLIRADDQDLGSREALRGAVELAWYPAEVNTSIRPGWFYHESEDSRVKSVDELLDIYFSSVGGNATFLLNVPPDRRGLIHETDAARLAELGSRLMATFARNLAEGAAACASESSDDQHSAAEALKGGAETHWRPKEETERAELRVNFPRGTAFDLVVLREHVLHCGQRVESFVLESLRDGDGGWDEIYRGTVIGYKRICRTKASRTRALRLRILESRWFPSIEFIGVYDSRAATK